MSHSISRRGLIKGTAAAAATIGVSRFTALSYGAIVGSNEDIRMGVIGFNSRGNSHIDAWTHMKGVRLVALCDCDEAVLDKAHARVTKKSSPTTRPSTPTTRPSEIDELAESKPVGKIEKYRDLRKMLDSKEIDGVSTATPNFWHSLITVWSCQAGKDVYVEKPVSHEVWEGQQSVAAARKYNRIVQAGTQNRSDAGKKKAFAWIQAGNLGKIKVAHGLCYKRRGTIGKVDAPPPVPASVDLDLWCGPTIKEAPHRQKFHYDWHWFWNTGNGDIGNQGIHQMDVSRWALGKNELSSRVLSVGGRFGYEDDAETPNTMFAIHDYGDCMLIFEVRGLPSKPGSPKMSNFHGQSVGHVVLCENGYLADKTAYDLDGKVIKDFSGKGPKDKDSDEPKDPQMGNHFANFIEGVRSRKISTLHADIHEGHLSSALCHTANISYRLGQKANPDEIKEAVKGDKDSLDTYERFREHLATNEVDISMDKAIFGVPLKMDPKTERFIDNEDANAMLKRSNYRAPFVLPDEV